MRTILPKSGFFTFIFLVSTLLFANVVFSQATVTTDKDDYAPGEYVIITGAGWEPGERVDFTFVETPKPATCVNSHDNFAIADASGNIYYGGFLIKENHLGVHFVLTATGQASGRIAVTEFTDANVKFSTLGLPSGISVTVQYQGTAGGSTGGPVNSSATFSTSGSGSSSTIALTGPLSFQFPSTITVSGTTYALVSTSPGSPTNVPINGSYDIIATYTTCTAPTALTYASNNPAYCTGMAVTANSPSNGGGTPTSYSVSPTLPAGLTLNTTTGVITGTPTVAIGATDYTVLAINSCGSTSKVINITVNAAPSALTYSSNTATYCRGGAVSANSPSSGGGTPTSYSVSPTLPVGLTLNATTGVITGTPTTVSVATNYTITAINSCGSTTKVINITINTAPAFTACPSNITSNTAAGACNAIVSYTATASGTPTPTISYVFTGVTTASGSGTGSGSTFNKGVTNVTITATNSCGIATCSFIVTVNDTQLPTITCNAPIVVSNDVDVCGATVTYTVTSADNCAGQTVAQTAGLASGSVFPIGVTTNTFVVTDASGNTATC
ncbi:putative Ig domain-containing protein, partial [Flavobacterium gillisiae]